MSLGPPKLRQVAQQEEHQTWDLFLCYHLRGPVHPSRFADFGSIGPLDATRTRRVVCDEQLLRTHRELLQTSSTSVAYFSAPAFQPLIRNVVQAHMPPQKVLDHYLEHDSY